MKDHVTVLANTCLLMGHHPTQWRRALVVVILKPRRDDYAVAKYYCPIPLLKCFSKLLEKAISKHMLYDIDAYGLIPTMQFRTHAFSCTLDAGLSLMHDIHIMHWGGGSSVAP